MFNINEIIKEEYLSINNKKVSNETINEYLTSFKIKELTRLAITQVFIDKDYINLIKINN